MRKTLILCLLSLLILNIAACNKVIDRFQFKEINKDKKNSLTIASVENPQLKTLKELSAKFEEEKGIKVNFIFFAENMLRSETTEDVAVQAGNYDIITLGSHDATFWAQRDWIEPLEPYFSKMSQQELIKYDREDFLKPIVNILSYKNELRALPFYGESSMIYYRKDLFEKAGVEMPLHPTWEQVYQLAKKLHEPEKGVYGIVLRGLPGYGQNVAVLNSMANTFGARWFDMEWKPQFDKPEMLETWKFYKKMTKEAGQPKVTSCGFKECSDIMKDGNAAIWYDATVGADLLEDKESKVAGKIGYAFAPYVKKEYSNWLFSWALVIEASSKNKEAAFEFIKWATSKEYINLVAEKHGWSQVPPGTRLSTHSNPKYKAAAPFADITFESITKADYEHPTVEPVPYIGLQDISIPEFKSMGEIVSQMLAQYLKDVRELENAIKECQTALDIITKENKYQK